MCVLNGNLQHHSCSEDGSDGIREVSSTYYSIYLCDDQFSEPGFLCKGKSSLRLGQSDDAEEILPS